MARLYNVSEATISRIVAAHRQLLFQEWSYTTLGTFMGLDPKYHFFNINHEYLQRVFEKYSKETA